MLVQPLDLTDEQKATIKGQIAEANCVLAEKALEYGYENVKALRKEFHSKSNHRRGQYLKFDQETRNSFKILMGLENCILSGYIKIVQKLANSFYYTSRHDRPHLEEEDFIQEGIWALFDTIYSYNGSTEYCTYAYCSIKKRLSNFVRREEIHSGIGRPTLLLRRKVRAIMREQFCSFNEAIAILRKSEDISLDMEEMVRLSCYNVKCVGGDESSIDRPVEKAQASEEVEQLLNAVKQADLNSVQRELIDGFLKNGERIDSKLVAAGSFTRQAYSQQWIKACEKIRDLMPQFAEEAA